MKIAMIIVRTLVGLLFIFSSVAYFFNLVEVPEMTGPVKTFNEGLAASGYFFTLLKVTELVCGILLVVGRVVPLALVILAPVVVNIFMFHLFLERTRLPIAAVLVLAMAFLGWYYRAIFRGLFEK
jgi:uncharacterized membrane protein YphA (DoxX/SURF4 family)